MRQAHRWIAGVRRAARVGLCATATACTVGPPSGPTTVVVTPPPDADAGPASPRGVSAVARAMPAALLVDGDLTEWGSLEGRHPSEGHVAIAVAADRVALAADLRGRMRDGAWLTVSFESNELPSVGGYDPFVGVIPADCDATPTEACRKTVEARRQLAARKGAAAVRVYRLDPSGLREKLADGSLAAPVEHASLRAVTSGDALRVEAVLPLSVLPQADTASVETIGLAAVPLAAPPAPADEARTMLSLPAPVIFEPMPELRLRAYELFVTASRRVAYFPGSPKVTIYTYAGDLHDLLYATTDAVIEVEELLFTPKRALGSIEIGSLLGGAGLAVVRQRKVLDARALEPIGIIERDGELHALQATAAGLPDGTSFGGYSGVAVAVDGRLREDLVEEDTEGYGWPRVREFHADDFSSFGFERERPATSSSPRALDTVVWTYDVKARRYVPHHLRGRGAPALAGKRARREHGP